MKVIDDFAYEVEGKMTTETTTVDDSTFGGNASTEGADDEGAESSSSRSGWYYPSVPGGSESQRHCVTLILSKAKQNLPPLE